MSRIKIEFERLPVPAQIAKSRDIQGKMSGNGFFTDPVPSLAEIKSATDELETWFTAALNNDREKKATMRTKRKKLKDLITSLADYIQIAGEGDETKILSSGFSIRRSKTPAAITDAPVQLKVKAPLHENELEVVWKPVKKAKSYMIEYTREPESFAPILETAVTTRARFIASGLESGIKYWFRVRAVNTAGYSGWSEIAGGRTL